MMLLPRPKINVNEWEVTIHNGRRLKEEVGKRGITIHTCVIRADSIPNFNNDFNCDGCGKTKPNTIERIAPPQPPPARAHLTCFHPDPSRPITRIDAAVVIPGARPPISSKQSTYSLATDYFLCFCGMSTEDRVI
jgi:hypothetical protein